MDSDTPKRQKLATALTQQHMNAICFSTLTNVFEGERETESEGWREGGMTLASCPYSPQLTQISHVTPKRHHHPLPIRLVFLPPSLLRPVREGDLSPHLKEGGSV